MEGGKKEQRDRHHAMLVEPQRFGFGELFECSKKETGKTAVSLLCRVFRMKVRQHQYSTM
jgi:hypothetical protein